MGRQTHYKRYTSATLKKATEEVLTGKIIALKAAQIYNIPMSTLHYYIAQRKKQLSGIPSKIEGGKAKGHQILSTSPKRKLQVVARKRPFSGNLRKRQRADDTDDTDYQEEPTEIVKRKLQVAARKRPFSGNLPKRQRADDTDDTDDSDDEEELIEIVETGTTLPRVEDRKEQTEIVETNTTVLRVDDKEESTEVDKTNATVPRRQTINNNSTTGKPAIAESPLIKLTETIDSAINQVFLHAGIPFEFADSEQWEQLMKLLNPLYAANMPKGSELEARYQGGNCVVCQSSLNGTRKLLVTPIGSKEVLLHVILESWTGKEFSEEERNNSSVCSGCFSNVVKFNDHQESCHEIQNMMACVFYQNQSEQTPVKQEPELDLIDDFSDSASSFTTRVPDTPQTLSVEEGTRCDQCGKMFIHRVGIFNKSPNRCGECVKQTGVLANHEKQTRSSNRPAMINKKYPHSESHSSHMHKQNGVQLSVSDFPECSTTKEPQLSMPQKSIRRRKLTM